MKTKEKTRRPAKSRVVEKPFPEMKVSDMTFNARKIHDLLTAEGFQYVEATSHRIEGMKCNNYQKVGRMEYVRGRESGNRTEHERIIVTAVGPYDPYIPQNQ